MSFSVSFRPPAHRGAPASVPVPSEPDEEYETLVMEACEALAEAGDGSFHMSGFGTPEWPLDVSYDLSAFMEQFPDLLAGLRAHREVEIDLYSQGIERTLTFRAEGGAVAIHCASRTQWVPDPEWERLPQGELMDMLTTLAADFADGLAAVHSGLAGVAPFNEWRERGNWQPRRADDTG
ncbi:hypothetical protein SAMN04487981_12926 [Streptomyces sp. cf386]|uniref:hypothetical protein n=1 Tax=Streptomyces sp. cf386 TaxID=1761904 RepID=UPI000882EE80|nr:hypothetical protein [Streptomyces sp. cf386]SDP61973.1 hypothetical protein SAMN04487981_12926 [Streptomyces sp. cf386]